MRRDELARLAERMSPSLGTTLAVSRRNALAAITLGAREQAAWLLLRLKEDEKQTTEKGAKVNTGVHLNLQHGSYARQPSSLPWRPCLSHRSHHPCHGDPAYAHGSHHSFRGGTACVKGMAPCSTDCATPLFVVAPLTCEGSSSLCPAVALTDSALLARERDCLMACLVASAISPDAQREAVLAAAELMPLHQAVPLLFLISRGADACHRLQLSGEWELAAVLAKASLSAEERREVLVRWAAELDGRGELWRAMEVTRKRYRFSDRRTSTLRPFPATGSLPQLPHRT